MMMKKKKKKKSKEMATSVGSAEDVQMVESLVPTKRENIKDKLRKKRGKSKNKINTSVGTVGENEVHVQEKSGKDRKKKSNWQLVEKSKAAHEDEVYEIPSGDDDCSKGMKKWLTEYNQSRPGLKVLQQRIDEFITVHEEKLEQERKEKEAQLTEGGWILVEHHKGRKKTTDSESGTTVGSVSQAAVEDKLAKKKSKEVSDFYRFQKREAQRNELLTLQSKFEQDKKRIQQMRAARKFRPY